MVGQALAAHVGETALHLRQGRHLFLEGGAPELHVVGVDGQDGRDIAGFGGADARSGAGRGGGRRVDGQRGVHDRVVTTAGWSRRVAGTALAHLAGRKAGPWSNLSAAPCYKGSFGGLSTALAELWHASSAASRSPAQLRAGLRTGSFSAAADRLGLSQPAVSQQVRQLEQRYGLRLLERVGRRARPTAAGEELLRHARSVAAALAATEAGMARHGTEVIGQVRLGSGATACIYLLPAVLRELRRRRCRTGDRGAHLPCGRGGARGRGQQPDLALVTLPASGRMLEVIPVVDDPLSRSARPTASRCRPRSRPPTWPAARWCCSRRAAIRAAWWTPGWHAVAWRPIRSWSWTAWRRSRSWWVPAWAIRYCPRWRCRPAGAARPSPCAGWPPAGTHAGRGAAP